MTFPEFLSRHCKVAKSRAYEIIAIAEGRITEEEINDKKNEKRSPAAAARSVRVRGQSVKQLSDQRSPEAVERSTLMSTIHSKLERLTLSQLHAIERLIPGLSAANRCSSVRLAA